MGEGTDREPPEGFSSATQGAAGLSSLDEATMQADSQLAGGPGVIGDDESIDAIDDDEYPRDERDDLTDYGLVDVTIIEFGGEG